MFIYRILLAVCHCQPTWAVSGCKGISHKSHHGFWNPITDPKNPTVLDVQVESRWLEGMIQGRTTHLGL